MKPIKQSIPINFAQGLDTKTDPKQIQMGNFLKLDNTVFTRGSQLTKRNGNQQLTALPNNSYTYLTTFNGNLTAIGDNIAAYDNPSKNWVQKGNIQPLELTTLPLIRNNFNQIACDSAVASNGLVCTAYLETNGTTTTNKFAIADSVTGQIIVAPTPIPVGSGTVSGGMRVFVLGVYFVIIFTNTISSTPELQYIAITTNNPTLIKTNTTISSHYAPAASLTWDGCVIDNLLYITWFTETGSHAIKTVTLNLSFSFSAVTTVVVNSIVYSCVSIAADVTLASPIIYVSFYSAADTLGYMIALSAGLGVIMNPLQIIYEESVANITSAAQNGSCQVFYEINNNYGFDNSLPTNYINSITVTILGFYFDSVFSSNASSITVSSAAGLVNGMYLVDNTTRGNISPATTFTVSGTTLTLSTNTAGNSASTPGDILTAATISSETTIVRSVGLASKAFILDGIIYFLSAYQSPYQPTYFVINASISLESAPIIVAKLAYSNGGGYLPYGLPNVTITDSVIQIPYLYKDLIAAVNKNTNVPSGTQTAGIYSQTGINLATFDAGTMGLDTAEIGQDLHISGGFLWMYDGQIPVEHNFFLWPDTDTGNPTAMWTWVDTPVTPTGSFSSGSYTVTLSSASGVAVGMSIQDSTNSTYIPSGTTITQLSGVTATISQATTHSGSGDTLAISGNMASKPDGSTNTDAYYYQITYEWTDNQGNAFRSAPSIPLAITTTDSDQTGSVTLTIPTLRLTYKTANPVKIVVYRWSVAQQIYYQTTNITMPLLNTTTADTVTFVDTNSDATILGNNIIYTTGGVVEDVNAPATNIMTLFDDRLWLVDAEDQNLLWFSKQVIESTPVEMSDLLTFYVAPSIGAQGSTGVITALSVMDDKIIIFKKNAIYYVNGTGPDNTGSNSQYSQPIFITATVGCDNQLSIVFMPQGLMFQSDKGIWLLGRDLSTQYIGAAVEQYNSQIVMSAQNIPGTNQVRFIMSGGITLMYDYYYAQWGTFSGIPAISSTLFQSMHTFINDIGEVYQENVGSYLDGTNPVLMSFQTGPLRLGSLQNYQRTFFYYLLGTYISPHKLLVSNYYDYSPNAYDSRVITPTNYASTWGSIGPWGQANLWGGVNSSLEDWRIFATKRCQALSIGVQEIYDPSFGVPAGAGFTLSGINLIVGFKGPFRTISSTNSAG